MVRLCDLPYAIGVLSKRNNRCLMEIVCPESSPGVNTGLLDMVGKDLVRKDFFFGGGVHT